MHVCVSGVAGGNRFLHVKRSRSRSKEHGGIPGAFTASLETRTSYWGVAVFLCKVSERNRNRRGSYFHHFIRFLSVMMMLYSPS